MTQTYVDPNEALNHFLDRYCLSDVAPGYAVMLRGPWGSGKTWFVERYRNRLEEQKKRSLYVTLFGVSKPSDIADQFFSQIHPKLAKPAVQKTWTIFKSLLKGTVKLDLDGDGKEDGTLQVSIPEIGKWASTEGAVLIFDDFERTGMSIDDTLGYINQFVEHDGYRVIVLANEERAIDRESGFQAIKEKVIGRTFQIQADADAALQHFLEEIPNRKAHSILSEHRLQVFEVFKRAEYENLRQLRQAVFDFADMWDCLHGNDLEKKTEFLVRLPVRRGRWSQLLRQKPGRNVARLGV